MEKTRTRDLDLRAVVKESFTTGAQLVKANKVSNAFSLSAAPLVTASLLVIHSFSFINKNECHTGWRHHETLIKPDPLSRIIAQPMTQLFFGLVEPPQPQEMS